MLYVPQDTTVCSGPSALLAVFSRRCGAHARTKCSARSSRRGRGGEELAGGVGHRGVFLVAELEALAVPYDGAGRRGEAVGVEPRRDVEFTVFAVVPGHLCCSSGQADAPVGAPALLVRPVPCALAGPSSSVLLPARPSVR